MRRSVSFGSRALQEPHSVDLPWLIFHRDRTIPDDDPGLAIGSPNPAPFSWAGLGRQAQSQP